MLVVLLAAVLVVPLPLLLLCWCPAGAQGLHDLQGRPGRHVLGAYQTWRFVWGEDF